MHKKEEKIKVQGKINKAVPGTAFLVELENGHIVTAHLCGKMRKNFIRIIPGDNVILELSPYDMTRGRIIKRI